MKIGKSSGSPSHVLFAIYLPQNLKFKTPLKHPCGSAWITETPTIKLKIQDLTRRHKKPSMCTPIRQVKSQLFCHETTKFLIFGSDLRTATVTVTTCCRNTPQISEFCACRLRGFELPTAQMFQRMPFPKYAHSVFCIGNQNEPAQIRRRTA